MIAFTAAASFFAPLNSSMVAVALPRVRDDFQIGVGPLTLLVSVYLVAVAVSQPVSGKCGDAFGHRHMILGGLALLFVSSLAAVFAWNFWVLIVTRAFQGVSAAMIMPNGVAYLRRHIDPDVLGRSLGYNGAAISAGAAMGPVLGGLAVAAAGWRSMFLINVPAAVIIAGLIYTLPRDDPRKPFAGVDVPSLAALVAGFSGLAVLGNAARFENPALIVGAALILPVAIVAYGALYRTRGHGVVELRLFTNRDYATAAFSTALTNLVMYTALIAIPIYLDELRDVGEAAIGLMLFSLSVSSVAFSPWAGIFTDRSGYRSPLALGAVILASGAASLAAIIGHLPPWAVALPLGTIGMGMAFASGASQWAAIRAWGPEVAGSAAGTQSMMRYVGSVGGAAMMAAVLGSHGSVSDMRLLMWLVAAFGAAHLVLALAALRTGGGTRRLAVTAADASTT
jgi:MFS family permease